MAFRSRQVLPFVLALFLSGSAAVGSDTASRDEEARIEFFEKKIRPLLAENCFNCHSANTNSRGGLRVDDRNGLIVGGERGSAVVPGHPEKSLLIEAVRQTHAKVKMPPKKQLSEAQIADLTRWIQEGAAWPKPRISISSGGYKVKYARLRAEHWAWQPLGEAAVPEVKDRSWARDDIDRFLLAGLEAKGMRPAPPADARTLIRRLTFDLTGLPPAPVEVERFVKAWAGASAKRDALLEELVDRLLASPAYGERWGRHWLDVARYGESTGSARNIPYPHAWRYRDYVIDAFNSDKPYDRFLREQIAGDLLPADSRRQRDEQLIATGFLALGVRDVNQRFKVRFVMDNIDEQIDTVTRAVLGLTVSCARCHDHKFDPIPTEDYYALAGIFHSTDLCAGVRNKMGGGGLDYYDTALLLRLGGDMAPDPKLTEKIEQTKATLAQARSHLIELTENPEKLPPGPEREKKLTLARQQIKKIQAELISLTDPARGPVALGARDANKIGDTEIRIRGEAELLGEMAPRGFLSLLDVPDAPAINSKQSGRLELAHWLSSENNPLTARVMVNRVWRHLFGRGLVRSVDNFGVTGDAPSHPQLLDHLARRFVQEGWSVKKLVRAIVLTRAYQLSSDATPEQLALDPDNRLVWRHSPRRLDAEEIRDAMLAVAASLDRSRPKNSIAKEFPVREIRNNGAEAKKLEAEGLASKHRSIYLPLVRGLTPRALEVFDFAEQGMVTGNRDTTTVATQALYLLNDPFVRDQAAGLTRRLFDRKDLDDEGRIALAYRLALGRLADTAEVDRARSYLADYRATLQEEKAVAPALSGREAWTSLCHALLASAEFRYVR